MSLAKTLIKVAIGVAVAKGVSTLVKGAKGGADGDTARSAGRPEGIEDIMDGIGGQRRTTTSTKGQGGFGDLLEEISGQGSKRSRTNAPKGGLEDMLGGDGQGGGLGDLLGQITGASSASRGATGGGLGDLLGQLTGGGAAQGGGLGDLLGAVLGGASGGALGGAMGGNQDSRQEDLTAALILRAMVAAVKADGKFDEGERQKLMQHAEGASREEIAYINAELERHTRVDELAEQVPEGMEAQIYVMSLMAIDLDNQKEAQYLHSLAQALSLSQREVNALHDRAGVQPLYN